MVKWLVAWKSETFAGEIKANHMRQTRQKFSETANVFTSSETQGQIAGGGGGGGGKRKRVGKN